jgi:hypothetical protein|tara:strand:+ start:10322 stop:10567 length:246 start_codon:yes stop_codon:yes gene_type:complete
MKTFFELREQKQVDEAPLVANDMEIVRSILSKIEDDFSKLSIKQQFEKGLPKLQVLAKMAGYKITKKGQQKNRTFRYDIKK